MAFNKEDSFIFLTVLTVGFPHFHPQPKIDSVWKSLTGEIMGNKWENPDCDLKSKINKQIYIQRILFLVFFEALSLKFVIFKDFKNNNQIDF